jgi:NitT/TauT family transport system substrate-binding protein
MKHPDAMAALLSGKSEITAHLTSPPYQYQELADKKVHRVLISYDVLGGPSTFNCIWATKKFRDDNPKVYAAFVGALDEAMSFIKANPKEASEIYIKAEKSKLPVETVLKMVTDPEISFTTVPQNIMKYAAFMTKTGAIDAAPKNWQEVFFPEIHGKKGS